MTARPAAPLIVNPMAHVALLRRNWVQQAVPFAASLAMHAAIVVVGLATYQAVTSKPPFETRPQPPLSPTEIGPIFTPGVFPTGSGTDSLDPLTVEIEPPPDVNWDPATVSGTVGSLIGDGGEAEEGETIIGVGTKERRRRIGDLTGVHVEQEPMIGPRRNLLIDTDKNPVFPPAAARSVAFVCDASGSMLNHFGTLKTEIARKVDGLQPVQGFNVIFFGADSAISVERSKLLMAHVDNKRKAYAFLETVSPRGETEPLAALELAFRQQPELIYLLTDGDFPDNAAVLALIRRLNADKRIRINTIAFIGRGEQYEDLLRLIAQENGGTFHYVSGDDLAR